MAKASRKFKSWRLADCDLYVTLEPCTMCAGAIVLSRIRRLVFGAADPKAGAVVSTARVMDNGKLNHRVKISDGILKEDCSRVLKDFFRTLRNKSDGSGDVAQLGEHLVRNEKVGGSIPLISTNFFSCWNTTGSNI